MQSPYNLLHVEIIKDCYNPNHRSTVSNQRRTKPSCLLIIGRLARGLARLRLLLHVGKRNMTHLKNGSVDVDCGSQLGWETIFEITQNSPFNKYVVLASIRAVFELLLHLNLVMNAMEE